MLFVHIPELLLRNLLCFSTWKVSRMLWRQYGHWMDTSSMEIGLMLRLL